MRRDLSEKNDGIKDRLELKFPRMRNQKYLKEKLFRIILKML